MRTRFVLAGLFLASLALAQPVREAEVSSDPPGDRKQVYTVRFAPGETAAYDALEFECRLEQPVPTLGARGTMTIKPHAIPHAHVHRERNVKMVKDLDCYVSFWVPVGVGELQSRFGIQVVKTNAPAHLSQLKVTAVQGGRSVWSLDLPTNGMARLPPDHGRGGQARLPVATGSGTP